MLGDIWTRDRGRRNSFSARSEARGLAAARAARQHDLVERGVAEDEVAKGRRRVARDFLRLRLVWEAWGVVSLADHRLRSVPPPAPGGWAALAVPRCHGGGKWLPLMLYY